MAWMSGNNFLTFKILRWQEKGYALDLKGSKTGTAIKKKTMAEKNELIKYVLKVPMNDKERVFYQRRIKNQDLKQWR